MTNNSMAPSPCTKYSDRVTCTSEGRHMTCEWASGNKKSSCRKISPKRLSRLKEVERKAAIRKIQSLSKRKRTAAKSPVSVPKVASPRPPSAKKSPKNTAVALYKDLIQEHMKKKSTATVPPPAMTPVSKHYAMVANAKGKERPSIMLFRSNCKLFPHPVEIFSTSGIGVPKSGNYAKVFSQGGPDNYTNFLNRIKEHVPQLKTNQYILKKADHAVFPKYRYKSGDIIIGLKKLPGHVVFFEVRMHDDSGTATVIEPNGATNPKNIEELDTFFDDIPYTVARTFHVNKNENRHKRIKHLEIENDDFDLGGYCATISCYYVLDYICTNQWKKLSIAHFVRASKEWLYSPHENRTGVYSPGSVALRVMLIGRYIAFELCKLLKLNTMSLPNANSDVKTMKIRVQTFYKNSKLYTRVFDGKEVLATWGDDNIRQIETDFFDDYFPAKTLSF